MMLLEILTLVLLLNSKANADCNFDYGETYFSELGYPYLLGSASVDCEI